jgi:putative phosphoribosyl transferase
MRPRNFFGVGQFYIDFSQTSDEEVSELLQLAQEDAEGRRKRRG